MSTSEVIFKQHDAIATITFNRPQARNAMTWSMYETLLEHCETVETTPSIRVLILRGAGGKAFVSGTDISQFRSFRKEIDGIEYEKKLDAVIERLETLATPTIAAINGVTTGGGCVMVVACDIRICTTTSRFGVPIARTLGNCVSASNIARFLDIIGPTRLKDMLYTGRLFLADEAASSGLVTRVVGSDDFESVVTEYAEMIAANAPLTIQATKQMIHRVQQHRRINPELGHDWIGRCYSSNDFREGVSSFLEKRRPVWKGQ